MSKKAKPVEPELKKTLSKESTPVCSGFLASSIKQNIDKFGRPHVYMGHEAEKLNIGIPWPAFSLAWLSDCNVLPISKIIGIAGPSGSQKSSLGFALTKMIMDYGGEGRLVETEGGKYSPSLMASLMSKDYFNNRLQIAPCGSLEVAQKQITDIITRYEEFGGSKDSVEMAKSSLVSIVLDSLAGQDSAKVAEKIYKEGSVPTSVASMSKAWWGYLRWLSSAMIGWPTTFIIVNHLLEGIGGMPGQPPSKYTPGGKAQRYFSSLSFFVNRGKKPDPRKTYTENGTTIKRDQEVRSLIIKTEKSSIGTEGRVLNVDFVWYVDESGEQVSYFDWHSATCDILVAEQMHLDARNSKQRLRDIIDVEPSGGQGAKSYSSKALGLKEAQDHEIGKVLMMNPELLKEVYAFFHIKHFNPWDGRMPRFTDNRKTVGKPPSVDESTQEAPDDAEDEVEHASPASGASRPSIPDKFDLPKDLEDTSM